jgi:hypothetical protein
MIPELCLVMRVQPDALFNFSVETMTFNHSSFGRASSVPSVVETVQDINLCIIMAEAVHLPGEAVATSQFSHLSRTSAKI